VVALSNPRNSSKLTVWWAGISASSTTTECEPEPLRPMRSPQSSATVKSARGIARITGGPSGVGARPMWCVA
jgi:hypothetical protein